MGIQLENISMITHIDPFTDVISLQMVALTDMVKFTTQKNHSKTLTHDRVSVSETTRDSRATVLDSQ